MKAQSKARPAKKKPSPPARPTRQTTVPPLPGESGLWESLALAGTAIDPREALDRVMEIAAARYQANRAWIGRYNTGLTHFWGISEWIRPGVTSHLHEMQGVSVDLLGMAHQKFLDGENVLIPDVERLPRQARALQAELRREGIRSTLAVPLAHEGRTIGFFGFDHVRTTAAWDAADLQRLPALARFFAALLHRSLVVTPPADLPSTSARSVRLSEPLGLRSLALDDIVFIKADGDYSQVHAGDGRPHLERRSLRTWIAQLPRDRFLRVHHGYLVNGTRIARLDRGARWKLHLQGISNPIPVGRAYRHALRLHLGF